MKSKKTPKADFAFDTVCFGDEVQFMDQTETIGRVLSKWEWSFGDTKTGSDENPRHTYSKGGNYTVELVVTTDDNCTDTISYDVFQPTEILAKLESSTDVSCNGLSDGSAIVSVSGGRGAKGYVWNTEPIQTGSSIDNLAAGSYTATITDSEGCKTTFDVVINGPDPLETTDIADLTACAGDLVIMSTQTSGGTEPYRYIWDCDDQDCEIETEENNEIKIRASKSNGYSVKVVDNNNCESGVQNGTVTILQKLEVDAGPDITTVEGRSVSLSAQSTSNGDFSWTPASVLDDENAKAPTAILYETTTFVVSIDSKEGCPATDTVVVNVVSGIKFPTAFSPNADGFNDTWEIENIELFPKSSVSILNRWGATIHSSDQYKVPWDGYYNGKELSAGAYFYIIDLGDGSETLTGSVTLLK